VRQETADAGVITPEDVDVWMMQKKAQMLDSTMHMSCTGGKLCCCEKQEA
jgi:hypothetical protein